jgi:hypothetical protein
MLHNFKRQWLTLCPPIPSGPNLLVCMALVLDAVSLDFMARIVWMRRPGIGEASSRSASLTMLMCLLILHLAITCSPSGGSQNKRRRFGQTVLTSRSLRPAPAQLHLHRRHQCHRLQLRHRLQLLARSTSALAFLMLVANVFLPLKVVLLLELAC